MSRSYRVEVEAKGICVRQLAEVMTDRFGWVEEHSCESDEVSCFSGEGCLCGGQSEEEAHEQIAAALKAMNAKALVLTRWTNLEELPCSEYGDDLKQEAGN